MANGEASRSKARQSTAKHGKAWAPENESLEKPQEFFSRGIHGVRGESECRPHALSIENDGLVAESRRLCCSQHVTKKAQAPSGVGSGGRGSSTGTAGIKRVTGEIVVMLTASKPPRT